MIDLFLQIQNNNKADFNYLVRLITKGDNCNKPANFGNRRIAKAFNHFSQRIEKAISSNIKELFDFLDKVTSACVVRIDTQDDLTPKS